MASVTFEQVTRTYSGSSTPAVDSIDLEIEDGEFLVLVGPSGCGKSTSLRMLAGLEPVDEGLIRIGGRDVTNVHPKNRDIAMVFQNYALYPQMTVAQNMGFALRNAGLAKTEISTKVAEAARILDLEGYLDRKPASLSGGQRQRVAMGRAIVRSPQVFLMDEPLSNLDAQLRVQTRTEISALQRRMGATTVYVTHDQVEAMTMAHRVAVLDSGQIQQVGTPHELYERPANAFVAKFIGSPPMNLVSGAFNGETVSVGDDTSIEVNPASAEAARRAGERDVWVGFRPEDVTIHSDGGGLRVRFDVVEVLGADAFGYSTLIGSTGTSNLVVRADGRTPPIVDSVATLRVTPNRTHLFSGATGSRL